MLCAALRLVKEHRIIMSSRLGRLLTGLLILVVLVGSFRSVIGLVGLVQPVSAQDSGTNANDPLTVALKSATEFLSQQLGVPITSIQNYTYSVENFPDDALGCPEPGQSYPPSPV